MSILLLLLGAGAPVPATDGMSVQIGFGYAALNEPASITWVDVTTRVQAMSINRGRSSELDTFQPGTLSLTLDNYDRLFDPEYAAGTYYGKLVANVPIRVIYTVSGVSYPRFYGFVNGWPQTYAPPKSAFVNVTATDGFKVLSWLRLPESVYAYEVAKDAPKVWWRLGEASGDLALDSSGNAIDGRWNRGDHAAVGGLLDGTSDGAAYFDGQRDASFIAAGSQATVVAAPYVVEAWVEADPSITPDSVANMIFQQQSPSAAQGVQFYGRAVGANPEHVSFVWADTLYGTYTTTGTPASTGLVLDGKRHHVVGYVNGSGTVSIVLDGTSRTLTSGAQVVPTAPLNVAVGGDPLVAPIASFCGTVDEFAIYSTDLGLTRIAAHYSAGVNPWADDDTGTRLGRILDVLSWPAGQRNIDTGETLLGFADLNMAAGLTYAQQLENTEQGRLFMAPDGKVTFHSRTHDLTVTTANTSQATFTDTGSGIEYEPDGFELTRDDRYLFREVTAARDGGTTITVRDSTLTATDEVQTRSLSGLLCRTDAEARNIAESFLLRYKTPKTRPSAWTVKPLDHTTDLQATLALDIGYRVTVEAKPQDTGTRYSADFHIESIQESWPGGPTQAATFTFTGSPVDSTSYFLWDSSLLDGTDVLR